jgi:hypothetical protein
VTDWKAVSKSQTPRICSVCRYVTDRGDRHPRCKRCDRGRACNDKGWHVCAANFAGCGPYCPDCAKAGHVRHTH